MIQSESTDSAEDLITQGIKKTKYLWLIGIAVYIGFLFYIGWSEIKDSLIQLNYVYLIGFVIIEILVLALRVGKWHIALRPEADITRLALLSKAGGNLTPGRLGEFSPLLIKHFRSSKIAAWIFLDRLLEASATLCLGLIGFVAVLGIAQGNAVLYASLFLLTGIVIASYLLMQERYVLKLQPLGEKFRVLKKPLDLLLSVSRELRLMRPRLPALAITSLMATALDIVMGYFICKSLGFEVAFTVLALTQVTHAVVSVIPITPNATGVPYLAAATILYQYGGVTEGALAIIVVLRTLLGNMTFWGLFFLFIRRKNSA